MNDQLTHTQKIKLGDKHARAVPMKSPALGEQYWNGVQDEPTTLEVEMEPKLHNDSKPTSAVIIVIAAVIAMTLLCAMVLPFVGRIPAWFMGGW